MYLPDKFCDEMKRILGDEYEDYLASMDASRKYGLRVNTAKISVEDFLKITPFELTPIPYISNGFYYERKRAAVEIPLLFCRLVLSSGSQCDDTGVPSSGRRRGCGT